MRITYDSEADAAYLSFAEVAPGSVKRTMACESSVGMINFDFGEDGRLLGIEIIEAQVLLPPAFLDPDQSVSITLKYDRPDDLAHFQFQEADARHRSFYADDKFTDLRIVHDDHGKIREVLLSRASEVLPLEIMTRIGAETGDMVTMKV